MNNNAFLGKGWSFPPAFSLQNLGPDMVTTETDVHQSIQVILRTRPGERVLQPNFGCSLDALQFEAVNSSLIGYVKELITKSILYHEPRVDLNRVAIDTERQLEGILLIELTYTIRATNSRFNMVFPFYLTETEQLQLESLGG